MSDADHDLSMCWGVPSDDAILKKNDPLLWEMKHAVKVKRLVEYDENWNGHYCPTCPSKSCKGKCSTDSSICGFADTLTNEYVKCSFRKDFEE